MLSVLKLPYMLQRGLFLVKFHGFCLWEAVLLCLEGTYNAGMRAAFGLGNRMYQVVPCSLHCLPSSHLC